MPRYQSGITLDPSGMSPDLREDISHSYLNTIMSTCSMSVGSSSGICSRTFRCLTADLGGKFRS
jgi:hypothetical protein